MEPNTIEEIMEQHRAEKEATQHSYFIDEMEGKTLNELNVRQQSYLYNELRSTYERLIEDKELRIKDLATLDKLAKKQKENKELFEAKKQKLRADMEGKTAEQLEAERKREAELTKMINRAIDKSLKKWGL